MRCCSRSPQIRTIPTQAKSTEIDIQDFGRFGLVLTHVGVDDNGRVGGRGVAVAEGGSAALDDGFATRGSTAREHRVLDGLETAPARVVLAVLPHQRREALRHNNQQLRKSCYMAVEL